VFPVRYELNFYINFLRYSVFKDTRVEAGSNTSTEILRAVGGDEKRSLKSETVEYGYESKGTRTQERLRWRLPAAYTRQTRPLLGENAHKNRAVIVKD
jgi:hypothetical protein